MKIVPLTTQLCIKVCGVVINYVPAKTTYSFYLFGQLGLEQLLVVHLLGNLLCKALSKLRIRLESLFDGLHPGMNLPSVCMQRRTDKHRILPRML